MECWSRPGILWSEQHLKNICHVIFSSHLIYVAQVWTPKLLSVKKSISRLQKKATRIITFSEFKAHHEPLCKKLNILKFVDNIELSNCLFVYDYLNKNLPKSYVDTFTRFDELNTTVTTRQAAIGILRKPRYFSTSFGLKSIYNNCIISWNKLTSEINKIHKLNFVNKLSCTDIDLMKLSRGKLKETITNHIISKYIE